MSGGDRQDRPDGTPRGAVESRPATLSAEDDAFLLELAEGIRNRGLEAPALLWLDSLRPLSFLGSQAMQFVNPMVQMLVPAERFGRLAEILEERAHLERLLLHIEALAGEEGEHG